LAIFDSFLYRFNFFGREEEAVPRLAEHPEVASRIAFNDHGDVAAAIVIFFETFDESDLSGEREVENIAALAGTEAHAGAGAHFDAGDFQEFQGDAILQQAEVEFVHWRFPEL
jgi:hypothetical protein